VTPLIVLALALALAGYLVTLGRMVLTGRPAPLPRSHPHELDPVTERLHV
jgi:hypothetical protein